MIQRYLHCLAGVLLCCLLTACSGPSEREHKQSLLLFGTLIEITLYAIPDALAARAFERLEQQFSYWHENWSPWQQGELVRINRALAQGESILLSADIEPLITQAIHLSAQTEGRFNPAIGKLINLWQIHLSDQPDVQPPDATAITRLVAAQPSMADLSLQDHLLSSRNPAVQLSLGAFAKGYAIEIASRQLLSMGINHAVISAGGDLKIIGHHGTREWRIGIRHPRAASMLGWFDARPGEGVTTSGDYERFYMFEGKRYHHILDPRTGYPTSNTTSLTIIHDDAGVADAAATAMFVAGPYEWRELAARLGIDYVLLVDKDGDIHMTAEMAGRVHLDEAFTGTLFLSDPL